jgi:hypothetical protein
MGFRGIFLPVKTVPQYVIGGDWSRWRGPPSPFAEGRGTEGEGFFTRGWQAGLDKPKGRVGDNNLKASLYRTNITPLIPLSS